MMIERPTMIIEMVSKSSNVAGSAWLAKVRIGGLGFVLSGRTKERVEIEI